MWSKLSEFAGVPAWRVLVSIGLTAFTMWRAYNALIYAELVGYFTVGLLTAMLVVMAGRRLAWITILLVVGASLFAGLMRAGAVSFLPREWIALISAVIVPIVILFAFQKLVSVRPWLGIILFPVLVLVFSLSVVLPRNATNSVYYKSVYIEMDDGVRLAADYYLPRSWNGEALPTIVTLTRYHRAARLNFPFNILIPQGSGNRQRLGNAGYATMAVDVRGTGASFGARETELSARELQDSVSVVDWIIDQP